MPRGVSVPPHWIRPDGCGKAVEFLRRVDVDGRKAKSASRSPSSATFSIKSAVHLSYGSVASFRVRFLPFR